MMSRPEDKGMDRSVKKQVDIILSASGWPQPTSPPTSFNVAEQAPPATSLSSVYDPLAKHPHSQTPFVQNIYTSTLSPVVRINSDVLVAEVASPIRRLPAILCPAAVLIPILIRGADILTALSA